MKKYLFIRNLACMTLMAHVALAAQTNVLKRVYYHSAGKDDQAISIEKGNLIFYFEGDQRVDLLSIDKQADRESRTFFFPLVESKNKEVKQALHDLAAIANESYEIIIHEVEKPLKGIKLTIRFNPALIGMAYDAFDSVNLKKGIVFRFYDRSVIEHLRKSGGSVLTVAHNRARQARVVIDCGHGGEDEGACYNGLKEKDINLHVGLAVAYLLKKKGIAVAMTRMRDETKSLSERIELANNSGADLFVSIHSNSAPNDQAHGIETFNIVPSRLEKESASFDEHDLDIAFAHLQERLEHSSNLAQSIQSSLLNTVRAVNTEVKDRKVKNAVLLVLLGTIMPSALVEIGFLSNQQEASRLATKEYQRHVALGIYRGILKYLDTVRS